MKTNELKSGTRIELTCGWRATLKDNKKGNIRMALVEGVVTELGSVYSCDIKFALIANKWIKIEHTVSQLNLQKLVAELL